jgi:hypothetical protein
VREDVPDLLAGLDVLGSSSTARVLHRDPRGDGAGVPVVATRVGATRS